VCALRPRKRYDSQFGRRVTGEGIIAEQIGKMFDVTCRKAGIAGESPTLSTAAFRRPAANQLSLFD
jgi:hypothetical protein